MICPFNLVSISPRHQPPPPPLLKKKRERNASVDRLIKKKTRKEKVGEFSNLKPSRNIKRKKKEKFSGSGGIRTHASEETGALNQRLRPLGHATIRYL